MWNNNNKIIKIKPDALIVATGLRKRCFPFPNNDLPGVYGAGAVQTINENVYGVKPAEGIDGLGGQYRANCQLPAAPGPYQV